MRSVDSATSAYLQARGGVVVRDLLWISAKDRDTGETASVGFWNDLDSVTLDVVSGETGATVTRTYHGSGTLISISPIPLTSDLTVRTITITLSHVSSAVAQAIRGYDPRFGHVEIHRALYDLSTRGLVAPPVPHFVGKINGAPMSTPRPGEEGEISLSVVSHSRELTRTNPLKRSDETQKRRNGDRFRMYSGVAGQWEFFWGDEKHRIDGSSYGGGGSGSILGHLIQAVGQGS